jgi:histidinol-phosphate aminotransferase
MSGSVVTPKSPSSNWLRSFLEPSLVDAGGYKIDAPSVDIKLDQNESPWDIPESIKRKVVERTIAKAWNRYPTPFTDDLADKLAAYAGTAPGTVLLGPGSNYLVSLVLSVFSKQIVKSAGKSGKVVIARPSFVLYENHCKYDGIPYETWNLNDDLEYELGLMPPLPKGSMVIFASPNNPVGNSLSRANFKKLLAANPETLFIADEAYVEYAEEPYTELLSEFSNVLLIRTLSKTFGCAGVRIGYIMGHPHYLNELKKLRLPYLLNHFSIAALEVLLEDSETQSHLAKIRENAIGSRQEMHRQLSAIGQKKGLYDVKNSEANFLLIRFKSQDEAMRCYQRLIADRILVRNISGGPGLARCLRVTLGNKTENAALVQSFANF